MSFFFTCLYALFIFWRPQEWMWPWLAGYQPINVIAILALISCGAEIMMGSIKVPQKLPHIFLGLGIYFAIIVSHAVHTYWAGITGSFEHFGKILIFYLLVILTVDSVRKIKILISIVVGMALMIAYHCYLQRVTGYGYYDLRVMMQPSGVRDEDGNMVILTRSFFFGIFDDPNDTALFLVSAAPLCLALLPRWGIIVTLPLALVLARISMFSESRGALMALGVTIMLFFGQFFSKKWLIMGGAVFIVFITFVVPVLSARGMIDQSSIERATYWGEANYIFKQHPLFGVGYSLLSSDYLEKDKAVHNSFIKAYTELGVFGYFFWFTLLCLAFFGNWYISEMKPETKEEKGLVRVARWMVPCLGGYYTAAYFLTRTYHLPLFLLMGISAALYRLAGEKVGIGRINQKMHMTKDKFWHWLALTPASIAFIYVSILIINKMR
jgi:putative inorganic carbon (HCO3(-)) transporter